MPSLLVFSRDPGPSNLLIATIETLAMPLDKICPNDWGALYAALAPMLPKPYIAARGAGEALWRAAGHVPTEWQGRDEFAAMKLIAEVGAGAVLTGASDIDEPGDRALWRAARRQGISSYAMLDHPANLAIRFQAPDAVIYPDWLCVPDDTFAERLVAAGAPSARIRVVGDLHHDRVRRLAADRSREEVEKLRADWGVRPGIKTVLFASECGREMAAVGRPSPYDEYEVLSRLLCSLDQGKYPTDESVDPKTLLVVVRPHPRDAPGKYAHVTERPTSLVQVVVSAEGAADVALLAADIVVGMNSSLLYEAVALGRPAISLTGHELQAGKSRAG